jgi:colicin import membrane protein
VRSKTSSRNPDWLRAASYAVALHAVVVVMLVVGFRFTSRPQPVHGPMHAVVVREPGPDLKENEKLRQEQEKEKKQQEKEREQQRVAEEEQRKEAEKKREAAERLKEEEAQRKKQAEADKRAREEERKKEQKLKQQQAEQSLREHLAEEEKSRTAARDARLASEADKYQGAIKQKVTRHWTRPAGSRKGLECIVRVRLIPGGEVVEAKVIRSSGDATFDRSAEAAIHKASPLPLPENPDLLERFREFQFRFKPENESG